MITACLGLGAEDVKPEPATEVKSSREGRDPSRLGLEEKWIVVVM